MKIGSISFTELLYLQNYHHYMQEEPFYMQVHPVYLQNKHLNLHSISNVQNSETGIRLFFKSVVFYENRRHRLYGIALFAELPSLYARRAMLFADSIGLFAK
ncbi:hypothetical protein [Cytobacillus firmus]|uniref:hypothetical protein n=1 Tax=Cytobacillus firmus TaxID=1399 RepID=UPI0018CEABAC|nr:hypothetical protein [Cytobacillus firmus]MBG9588257.1 hypothetical protein [Cytobacillus firmus]